MNSMGNMQELLEKELMNITSSLNRRRWLPFVSKRSVIRSLSDIMNILNSSYKKRIQENSLKTLNRMNELDALFKEREDEQKRQFNMALDKQKAAAIKASSMAFCHGVCKERSNTNDEVICLCQRRSRYVKALKESIETYMSEIKK